jgi:hypothetical protein
MRIQATTLRSAARLWRWAVAIAHGLLAFSLIGADGCSLAPTTTAPQNVSAGCPTGYAECGALCCYPGSTCRDGSCVYPYSTASLYAYMCPSDWSGCTMPKYFSLGSECAQASALTPGTCVNTGLQVSASQSYAFANCQACGNSCSNPVSVDTPSGFVSDTYAPGLTFYCGSACTPPPDCGGVSAASSGSPGASSSGASSGGSSGSGGGGGTTSGVTTCGNCPGQLECSTIVGACIVQSCACAYVIDGSDGDSTWYLANGGCFMCQQNGLTTGDCTAAATAAAQAIVNCQ